jgi:putative alpha-1,2-mannosidase
MRRFYGMGEKGLALSGMDDAGEMSSWYVFNAIGFYPYSPADPDYIISVPLFNRVVMKLSNGRDFTVVKRNSGTEITEITYDNRKLNGYFLPHRELMEGKKLVIRTR